MSLILVDHYVCFLPTSLQLLACLGSPHKGFILAFNLNSLIIQARHPRSDALYLSGGAGLLLALKKGLIVRNAKSKIETSWLWRAVQSAVVKYSGENVTFIGKTTV